MCVSGVTLFRSQHFNRWEAYVTYVETVEAEQLQGFPLHSDRGILVNKQSIFGAFGREMQVNLGICREKCRRILRSNQLVYNGLEDASRN